MKINKSLLIPATILLLLSNCNVYRDVAVSSDLSIDFLSYHTFAWLPDVVDSSGPPYNDEIVRNNLKNYFGQNFSKRGYVFDSVNPDLLLQISIVAKQKELVMFSRPHTEPFYFSRYYCKSDYYSPYPFNYYFHSAFYCYPTGYCTETVGYVEGSISLNVIDRLNNKLIWSCTAKGDIHDPLYRNSNIHPAVRKIMKRFPISPVKHKKNKENAVRAISYADSMNFN